MVYTKKKQKFAILVDEFGKSKRKLNKLRDLLDEEYPFLKQARRVVSSKRLATAKKGDYIVFGFSKTYDFRILTEEQWEEYSVGRRTPDPALRDDWKDVKYYLKRYAKANYPDKFEDDIICCPRYCKKNTLCVGGISYDDIYVVQQPKKRSVKKRSNKNTKALKEVSIFHNFVKVGWDVYDILLNGDGEEYFKRGGFTYWIDRDYNGVGKLSVQ